MNAAVLLLLLATRTWTGAAGAAWSNPANWNGGVPLAGDDVVFPLNTTPLSITNDLPAGLTLHSLAINGVCKINGNAVSLGEGGLYTAGAYVSIIESDLFFAGVTLNASQTWSSSARATRTVVGPTNVNGQTLTLSVTPLLIINELDGAGALVQDGSGTTTVAASTFTGTITVRDGTLQLTGNAGNAQVRGGALATFSGTLGEVAVAGPGALNPNKPGTVSKLELTATGKAAQFGPVLTQALPPTLHVLGGVSLGSARLQVVNLGTFTPGTTLTAISNDAPGPIAGTFLGLAEGSIVNSGGGSFRLSYIGGDGNDVTLTAMQRLDDTSMSLSATPAKLSVTVTSFTGVPQGIVRFYDGVKPLGTATLDAAGRAVLAVNLPGAHEINAVYGGAGTFAVSQATASFTTRSRAVR